MGLFDYVKCERPLPDGWKPGELQTKDFDCPYMERYTIRADGRLIHDKPRYDITPADEPCGEVDTNFHGDLRFYGIEDEGCDGKRWHEYRARFTHGSLEYIDLVENRLLGSHSHMDAVIASDGGE